MSDLYRDVLPVDLVSARDALPFWEGCRERRLLLCRCRACARWIHFPRAVCPACWSDDIDRVEVSGEGRLFTFVVERDGRVTGVVELVEQAGLRLPCTIVGAEPGALALDMPMRLVWIDFQGLPVPAFTPAEGTGAAQGTAAHEDTAAR